MLHSPHKQPQNHKCGANFLQEDSKKSLVFKWLNSAGHYQPPRPTEAFKASSVIYTRRYKFYLKKKRGGTMASNSLFSTVTPCQQNFFWDFKLSGDGHPIYDLPQRQELSPSKEP
ncbi:LOW QUALITY PROTEIN: runt-related transcription factor 2-like [Tachyglossus aculeatus]|uniref:LOW QUALITY PROTEIN: runt-related transcription factor 2-like n=1 Tax=Tachyglossus aculeatus TaxID=9261 RepID=UPI0018F34E61|nr:LOW QUALITY PROTEIN: runt-related transcription factor 2-like [Tachyglossus aculeatus]